MLSNSEIKIHEKNGVGIITLNRPEVLNSLNLNMVTIMRKYLNKWESDKSIMVIVIESVNKKAFCAGGDIKAIYESDTNHKVRQLADEFFEEEYRLDELIYNYKKPIIANMNGIIMGGGVGLTFGAEFRIITEKTRWAMPEINLGFFPDVGAGYFLNKMPGYIGTYLALTGAWLKGMDILHVGAADYLINSNLIDDCMTEIKDETIYSKDKVNTQLRDIFAKYKSTYSGSEIEEREKMINKHFRFGSVEEIISSLKANNSGYLEEAYNILKNASPVSLKVILKQLKVYKEKTIKESLKIDRVLVSNFLDHNDFYEGVRSVLVDKDRKPNYEYIRLEEVSDLFVDSFFKS